MPEPTPTTAKPPRLCWVDIETTGLDPERHSILEVAIIVTDGDLSEIARGEWVFRPEINANWAAEAAVMHDKSGLLALANRAPSQFYPGELHDFIVMNECAGSPMCGASVHFDRAWLRVNALSLERHFHYRNLDVTSGLMLAGLAGLNPPEFKRGIHRAIPDLEDSINAARWLRDRLRGGM